MGIDLASLHAIWMVLDEKGKNIDVPILDCFLWKDVDLCDSVIIMICACVLACCYCLGLSDDVFLLFW